MHIPRSGYALTAESPLGRFLEARHPCECGEVRFAGMSQHELYRRQRGLHTGAASWWSLDIQIHVQNIQQLMRREWLCTAVAFTFQA